MKGVVVKFQRLRGFGFIRVEGIRADYFCHQSEVLDGKPLVVGQIVDFEPAEGAKGPEARRVVPGRRPFSPTTVFGATGLILAAAIAAFANLYVPFVDRLLGWILGASVSTFAIYGLDKTLARLQRTRVPESVLLGLAALGGSPGALAAMRVFRHKTIKQSFLIAFWTIVLLQLALLGAYYFVPESWYPRFS